MSENKSSVVTIGCKLPHGLELSVKKPDGDIDRVTINGMNASRIVGGYGITENVSADFWNAWLKKNHKFPALANGTLFVHTDTKSVEGEAKNRRTVTTGLEPIDPIKAGMMKGADGNNDPEALKMYQKQMQDNPDRNRQRVE